MAFDTITGAIASTATTFGGAALNKISNLLNGAGSEVATINDDDIKFVDPADSTKTLRFNADAISTSTDVICSVKSDSAVNLGSVGTHEVYIPAGAMYTVTTNGADYATRELATNDIMISSFAFDTTTAQKTQFNWATPANWNAGTIKFKLYWTTTGGSSAQTVDFDLAGVSFANDNPMDTAVGTAQNVTDTWIADDDLHVSAYSSAITIAGSPVAGELVVFQLSRDVAADDLGVDAEVVGVLVEYSTDASNSSQLSLPYLQPYFGLSNSLQTAQAGGAVASGGWVELARTTTGSALSDFDVSSLADKRYYMVLTNIKGKNNSGVNWQTRMGNSTIDTGSNYAIRYNLNGGTDSTGGSTSSIQSGTNPTDKPQFSVAYISNLSGKEKLYMSHDVNQQTAGAGNAPKRGEYVGKWVNTSNPLDTIGATTGSGSYTMSSGSEMVVLGWDPADTHTTNFWEELASVELGAPSSTLDSGTFTAKKYLWIQAYINATTVDTGLTFNGDTGTNYAKRWSDNGAADGTAVSGNNIQVDRGNSTQFLNIFIVNNSANEKLGMYHTGTQQTAGAGNAPARRELVFKWANTSAQITSMIFTKKGGGTDLQTGSIVKVWGSD